MPDSLDLLTYLAGEPGPGVASPRVGDAVELRVLKGGLAIEAFSAAGERLGRLPPAERDALAGLIAGAGTSLPGRVTAVLPRPRGLGGGRVHISVAAG